MNLNEIKKRVADIELVNYTEPITTLNVPMTVNEMKALLSLNESYKEALKKISVTLPKEHHCEHTLKMREIAIKALEE